MHLFPHSSKQSDRGFDHAVLVIHTHSDETTGDLWYCSTDADSGEPAATPIDNVFFPLSLSIFSNSPV